MFTYGNYTTFGILGVPLDSVDLGFVSHLIDQSAKSRRRLLISTVNANFLVASSHDRDFRGSLIKSDLCTVDGVGVAVLGKLLGVQLPRAAGADILEVLCDRPETELGRPLRVFFFGGAKGVADAAHDRMNQLGSDAVLCVGAIDPGFGSVDELSRPEWIDAINDAHPDLLILALGAARGQAWLLHNSESLTVPVRTHFGAAVNFLAGTIQRAPAIVRRFGLEWFWRILMEPQLAKRYSADGLALLRLTLSNVLPLAMLLACDRLFRPEQTLAATVIASGNEVTVNLAGHAGAITIPKLQAVFDEALAAEAPVTLDLGGLTSLGLDGLGAIMRMRRDLESQGLPLQLTHVKPHIRRRMNLAAAGWET